LHKSFRAALGGQNITLTRHWQIAAVWR